MKKTIIFLVVKFGEYDNSYDTHPFHWEVNKCAFKKKEKAVEYIHNEIQKGKLTNFWDEVFHISEDQMPTEAQLSLACGWSIGPDSDYAGYKIEEVVLW